MFDPFGVALSDQHVGFTKIWPLSGSVYYTPEGIEPFVKTIWWKGELTPKESIGIPKGLDIYKKTMTNNKSTPKGVVPA